MDTPKETPIPEKIKRMERQMAEKKQSIWDKPAFWNWLTVLSAVVLVLGIVGFLVFSGKDISIEKTITLIVAVAGALGLGLRSMRNGNGGGGAAVGGGLIVIAAATLLSGCGAQLQPCTIERAIVDVASAGVVAADAAVPDNAEGRDISFEIAQAGVDLGRDLVENCDGSAEAGSIEWYDLMLSALRGVAAIVGAVTSAPMASMASMASMAEPPVVGEEPPDPVPELTSAILALEEAVNRE